MSTQSLTSSTSGNGTRANMTEADSFTYVASGVSIVIANATVVVGSGINQSLVSEGSLISLSLPAVSLVGDEARVTVGEQGSLVTNTSGDNAALNLGGFDSVLENRGAITGGLGVTVLSGTQIVNTGNISGLGGGDAIGTTGLYSGIGIGLHNTQVSGLGQFDIENYGMIRGQEYAIYVANDAGVPDLAAVNLSNYGTISGNILLGGGEDVVLNGGLIVGDVDLGAGNDFYRLMTGGQVDGILTGGYGNDRMIGNAEDNVFYGGNNTDRLIMGDGNDEGYGGVGNDRLEGGHGNDLLQGDKGRDVLLGGWGDDVLRGGQQDDTLKGGRGDDSLSGGDDNDILNGGRGDDTLAGGTGADTFVFGRNVHDDVITDFEVGVDQVDLSIFGVATFGDLTSSGALTDRANGAFVDVDMLGGKGSILFEGVALSALTSEDFLL
ncbi:MAG: Ca2+-binding RTX toxin-like protein [Paracoccaceae bacterium]|jgi:Ca2+-binding RTX toxin-like protein